MYNKIYLTLLTSNNNQITEYVNNELTFVEGRKNSEYKIKVNNPTNTRIKVVLSVDGLDVISGKRADTNSQGYVINAFESLVVDGWRINNDQVRKFFFSTAKGSYNAKTGNDTNNLGVIGLMAFQEKVIHQSYYSWNVIPNGHYLGAAGMADSSFGSVNCSYTNGMNAVGSTTMKLAKGTTRSVGTGMGVAKESKVQTVHLNWEISPFVTMALYYKTRKELQALGIVVAPAKSTALPSPFANYCKQV